MRRINAGWAGIFGLIAAAACGLVLVSAAARWAVVCAEESPVTTTVTAKSRASDVAILLARNCLECHNASDRKGGLDLTRREQALLGGDSGNVLKPSDLDSVLLKRIDAAEMPPKGRDKLSADDRKLLRDWVKDGAIWAADPIDPFLYQRPPSRLQLVVPATAPSRRTARHRS